MRNGLSLGRSPLDANAEGQRGTAFLMICSSGMSSKSSMDVAEASLRTFVAICPASFPLRSLLKQKNVRRSAPMGPSEAIFRSYIVGYRFIRAEDAICDINFRLYLRTLK